MKTAYIVFSSPAGSTRHVANVMADWLREKTIVVHQLDLSIIKDPSRFIDRINADGADACLFVGSPVYRDLAVTPVLSFIEQLPPADGCQAVPFVTWGGANSGIALWQMGQALQAKGYGLAGAAKVLAVHSLMWQSNPPVGNGRPDADDDRQIRELVETVAQQTGASTAQSIALSTLDYQPEAVSAEIKEKLGLPPMIIPKTIDEERCTACAICKQVCPVAAVTLDPGPVFNDRCIGCFNCVRECPEEAIIPGIPLDKLDARIRERVKKFDERPHTQIFI